MQSNAVFFPCLFMSSLSSSIKRKKEKTFPKQNDNRNQKTTFFKPFCSSLNLIAGKSEKKTFIPHGEKKDAKNFAWVRILKTSIIYFMAMGRMKKKIFNLDSLIWHLHNVLKAKLSLFAPREKFRIKTSLIKIFFIFFTTANFLFSYSPPERDEVGVHGDVVDDPIGEGHLADVDELAGADGPLDDVLFELAIAESRRLMQKGQHEDDGDGLLGLGQRAPRPRDGRVTHVDVPLHGQGQREPDRGRVEDLRHVLQHDDVGIARFSVADRAVVAQRVNVKVPKNKQCRLNRLPVLYFIRGKGGRNFFYGCWREKKS